jgi:hypothetical protein
MDRQLVYANQIAFETDILSTNRNIYIAVGLYMLAVTGASTLLSGFTCTQDSPPDLGVTVGGGQIYSLEVVDETPYSTLPADTTDQIIKQGILLSTTSLPMPAPVTPGDAINYLVEIAFDEADVDPQNRPYYNSANPTQPIFNTEPNLRQDTAIVQSKAGTPAPSGTQTTPTPDPGFIGAYVVTVQYGQTTITDSNISVLSGAPFITETLTQKISEATADTLYPRKSAIQAGSLIYGVDTGAANAYVLALTPALTVYSNGMEARFLVGNSNTGPSTLNISGLGVIPVLNTDGSPLLGGELSANTICFAFYLNGNFYVQNPANASGGGFGTGDGKMSLNSATQPGWVQANDGTIGNASSNATTRANADTANLFKMLWDFPEEFFPMFDSTGNVAARGSSAEDDFAANNQMQLGYIAGRALANCNFSSYYKDFTADSTGHTFTVDDTTSLLTGTQFTLSNMGGALPTGLAPSTTYYAINLTSTTIQPASSLANALAGVPIAFTDAGSGDNFLTVVLPTHVAGSYIGEESHNQLPGEVGPHPHQMFPSASNAWSASGTVASLDSDGGGNVLTDQFGLLNPLVVTSQPNVSTSGFNILQPTFYWYVYIKL